MISFLVALVGLAITVIAWSHAGLSVFVGTCGDARAPLDSPQGQLCESLDGDAGSLLLFLLLLGFAALFVWAVVRIARWARADGPLWPALALLLLPPVLSVLAAGLVQVPSDECPPEKQAAYDQWRYEAVAGEPVGERPYFC